MMQRFWMVKGIFGKAWKKHFKPGRCLQPSSFGYGTRLCVISRACDGNNHERQSVAQSFSSLAEYFTYRQTQRRKNHVPSSNFVILSRIRGSAGYPARSPFVWRSSSRQFIRRFLGSALFNILVPMPILLAHMDMEARTVQFWCRRAMQGDIPSF